MSIRPIEYRDGAIRMIDQRLLPTQEVWIRYRDYQSVAEAIRSMVVRGAPAIGVAAAFGVAFGARDIAAAGFGEFYAELEKVCATLAATRPTAVNLFWALDRMRTRARQLAGSPLDDIRTELLNEALAVAAEDEAINRAMGHHGAVVIPDGARILTHCNAGAL
ncbi:MAG: S-methyl-5-thioribose-1-phosphate isomerase, partial [Syntrophotalea acetylenica]|nr:S-methyl-5-thioribose-1-phosphate isomerase [Syntrophotalea acetylenica]